MVRDEAPHRLEDRDVPAPLHHQHDERGDDVQRRDDYDEADCDRDAHLLQPHGPEEGRVQPRPVVRHVARPQQVRNRIRHRLRRHRILDPQLHHRHALCVEEPSGRIQRDEAERLVVLEQPQPEDADHLQPAHPRLDTHRSGRARRRQDADRVADEGAQLLREALADHDAAPRRPLQRLRDGQVGQPAVGQRRRKLGSLRLQLRIDTLEPDERLPLAGEGQRLALHGGGRRNHPRHLQQLLRFLPVVVETACLPDVDVRGPSDDPVPDLLGQAGHQGEGDDEGHDPDQDPENRDERRARDRRLLAPGRQVAQRQVQLEGRWAHRQSPWRGPLRAGRSNGNRITSRIDERFVSSITSRSMPMPSPPVGGRP